MHFSNVLLILALGAVGAISTVTSLPLHAAEADSAAPVDSRFTLRGFGTLGAARSTSDQVELVRDLSQPRGISNHWSSRIDSMLGVQASWQALPDVELVSQLVSRYQSDESRSPELMWAFAKWDPDARVSVRSGRLGADFMMAADSRLVGYSYLTVRPSTDFFGPLFFSYFDGADTQLSLPVVDGVLRGKVFLGRTRENGSSAGRLWNVEGSALRGWVLDYFHGAWQLRLSSAQIRFSNDMPFAPLPAMLRAAGTAYGIPSALSAADAIGVAGTTSKFFTLGAVYDNGPLRVQGMVNRIHHGSGTFQNSHAGYVLGGYRWASLTPFVGVSWWKSTPKRFVTGLPNPAFAALNTPFDIIMADSGADQFTYTLGARWDVQESVALKAQWDAIRGSARSLFPYRGDQPGWNGRTNVLSLSVDFLF